ncbi:MAG: permease [Euryarchaeota archaeon]|nr:permease [Euryarchaeota archaeon]
MKEKRATKNGIKKKGGGYYYGLYFLGAVIGLYIVLYLLKPDSIQKALKASGNVLIQIVPVLFLILILMGIVNYFVKPKTVSKYVGKGSGIKGWFLAVSTGMLSHGPIYIWYPLLKDLRDQGMRSGLVAVFLYNRAIKIPLLPLMVYYFGTVFVVLLLIYMVIASIVEGKVIEMIER